MGKKEKEFVQEASDNIPEDVKAVVNLTDIRESKGMTIKEMAHRTKISPANLEAIEHRDFNRLPEPVYARGFIKTYAELVGIDSKKLLEDYDSFLQAQGTTDETSLLAGRRYGQKSHVGFYLLASFVLLVVLCAILFYFYTVKVSERSQSPQAKALETPQKAIDMVQIPVAVPNEVKKESLVMNQPTNNDISLEKQDFSDEKNIIVKAAETMQETAENNPEDGAADILREDTFQKESSANVSLSVEKEKHVLSIEATELTWIRIKKDTDPPYEVMLRAGDSLVREASEKFILDIGNSGGVAIFFDGEPLKIKKERGKVIHVTLPVDTTE